MENKNNQIIIYSGADGQTKTEHINNVFKEGELEENSVCRFFRRTGSNTKEYQVKHYNFDAIISVGYRVNSIRGT